MYYGSSILKTCQFLLAIILRNVCCCARITQKLKYEYYTSICYQFGVKSWRSSFSYTALLSNELQSEYDNRYHHATYSHTFVRLYIM